MINLLTYKPTRICFTLPLFLYFLCFSFSCLLSGIDQMFQMEPSNTFGVLGQSAVIMCAPPNSVPPAVVQWLKDSSPITDSRFTVSSNGSLLISSVQSGDAGQYTCTATNQHLSVTRTSSPAQFQVFGTSLQYIISIQLYVFLAFLHKAELQ